MNSDFKSSSNRYIENELNLALKFSLVTLIEGPMAAGKTTLVKMVGKGYSRYDLRSESKRAMAKHHPEVFLSGSKLPAIIENIEEATELLPVIYNNRSRLRPGSLILTTNRIPSNELSKFIITMDKQLSVFHLPYLSFDERSNRDTFDLNLSAIKIPAMQENDDNILELAGRAMISGSELKAVKFLVFIKEMALKAGFSALEAENIKQVLNELAKHQLEALNITRISQKLEMPKQFIVAVIHLLERYEIIWRLEPLSDDSLGYTTKTDLIVFKSQSLVCELLKIKKPELLLISDQANQVLNAYLINALTGKLINRREIFKTYYFENSNGRKVDLIINRAGKLHLVVIQLRIVSDKRLAQIEKIFSKSGLEIGSSFVVTYDTDTKGDISIFDRITPKLIE